MDTFTEALRNGSEDGEKIPKPVSCPVLERAYDRIWWLKAVLVLEDGMWFLSWLGSTCSRAAVPNLFGTRGWFPGRQFFHRPRGWGRGMIQAVMPAMGSSRWSFAHSPTAHPLLCGLVPNRPRILDPCSRAWSWRSKIVSPVNPVICQLGLLPILLAVFEAKYLNLEGREYLNSPRLKN